MNCYWFKFRHHRYSFNSTHLRSRFLRIHPIHLFLTLNLPKLTDHPYKLSTNRAQKIHLKMPKTTKISRSRLNTSMVSSQRTDQSIFPERTPPDSQASPNSDSHIQLQSNENRQSLLTWVLILSRSVSLKQGPNASTGSPGKGKRPGNNPVGRAGNKLCYQCDKAKKGVCVFNLLIESVLWRNFPKRFIVIVALVRDTSVAVPRLRERDCCRFSLKLPKKTPCAIWGVSRQNLENKFLTRRTTNSFAREHMFVNREWPRGKNPQVQIPC